MPPSTTPQQTSLDTAPPAAPVVSPQVEANKQTSEVQELPQPKPPSNAKTTKTPAKKAVSEPKKSSTSRKSPARSRSATAKKTAAKKSAARRAAANTSATNPDGLNETQVAEKYVNGVRKWNTGRDFDRNMEAMGLDPVRTREEISRIRGERITAEAKR